ncbi:MAG: caspase family protein [Bacteroidia bacterium]|nr:caspase family protein [Bacteroidia bacterium]
MNYALLVGINDYRSPRVQDLLGAQNDVTLVENYLLEESGLDFSTERILGEDATYESIIEQFREHLGNAGKGDIALFYFSGHGSTRKSPEVLVESMTDDYHENLVCYNTRIDSYDLADIELKYLIKELTDKPEAPEVVVILDCCHSGSGTRIEHISYSLSRTKKAPPNVEQRPEDSFIEGSTGEENRNANPPHILFAACGPREKAIERKVNQAENPKVQGLFTYHLINVLRDTKGQISYSNLAAVVRNRVKRLLSQVEAYNPRLETYGNLRSESIFLQHDKLGSSLTGYLVFSKEWNRWVINQGVIHGIQSGTQARYSVSFPKGDIIETHEVSTIAIGLAESPVDMSNVPQHGLYYKGKQYKAVPVDVVRDKLSIIDDNGVEELILPHLKSEETILSELLAQEKTVDGDSFLFSTENFKANFDLIPRERLLEGINDSSGYKAAHTDNGLRITYNETGRMLLDSIHRKPPFDKHIIGLQRAKILTRAFDQIATWERARKLGNPKFKCPDKLKIYFWEKNKEHAHHQTHITLDFDPDGPKNRFNIHWDYQLEDGPGMQFVPNYYFQTFYLSNKFSVKVDDVGSQIGFFVSKLKLNPKDRPLLIKQQRDGKMPFQIFDIFKVIGSPKPLPYLEMGYKESIWQLFLILMDDSPSPPVEHEQYNQWFHKDFIIKSLYTLGEFPSNEEKEIKLRDTGLSIMPHKTFKVKIALSGCASHLQPSAADLYIKQIARFFELELCIFEEDDMISQIELFDISNPLVLLKDNLIFKMKRAHDPNKLLLAVTLPQSLKQSRANSAWVQQIGWWIWDEDENLYKLKLSRIPANPDDGRATKGKSLKISTFIFDKSRKWEVMKSLNLAVGKSRLDS